MNSLSGLRKYLLSILRRAARPSAVEAAAGPFPSIVYSDAEGGLTHAQHLSQHGQRTLDVAAPSAAAVNRVRLVADVAANPARVEAVGDGASVDLALRPQGPAGSVTLQTSSGVAVLTAASGGVSSSVPLSSSGLLSVTVTDAATVTSTNCLKLSHTTTDTAAAGFGARLYFSLENAAGVGQDAGALDCVWVNAGAGAEGSAFVLSLRTGGGALTETLRVVPGGALYLTGAAPTIQALTAGGSITVTPGTGGYLTLTGDTGSAVVTVDRSGGVNRLGFFGVGPVVQGVAITDAVGGDEVAKINAILAVLRANGLIAT